jgi:hypothetical protein
MGSQKLGSSLSLVQPIWLVLFLSCAAGFALPGGNIDVGCLADVTGQVDGQPKAGEFFLSFT